MTALTVNVFERVEPGLVEPKFLKTIRLVVRPNSEDALTLDGKIFAVTGILLSNIDEQKAGDADLAIHVQRISS